MPIPAGSTGLTFATHDQVAEKFRPLTPAEQAVVTSWLETASRLLRHRFPDIDARIASGDLDAALAADAAVQMVLRVVRKPGALAGVGNLRSETTGPFRRDFYPDADGDLDIVVTDAEVALIAPAPTGGRRKPAGTIWAQSGLAPAVPHRRAVGGNRVHLW